MDKVSKERIPKDEDENESNEDESKSKVVSKSTWLPYFGITFSVISTVLASTNTVISKTITSVHPLQIGTIRYFVQFAILLPIVQYRHRSIDIVGPKNKKVLLWIQSFLASTYILLIYLGVGKLPVGNAVTLVFMSTVLTPIIARIFLKERFEILDGVFVILALAGVVLVSKPTFLFGKQENSEDQSNVEGVLYSLGAALFLSLTMVTVRKLGKDTHFLLNVLYLSFTGAITTTALLIPMKLFKFPCMSDVPALLASGVIGILGQTFMTLSLQWEKASTISILKTLQIVFVYAMQVIFLHSIPSTLTIVGAGLILSSSIGIGVKKIISERRGK